MSQRELKDLARSIYKKLNETDLDQFLNFMEQLVDKGTFMSDVEIEDVACSLYDGGWRKEDKEEIINEYDCTENEAIMICNYLENLEEENELSEMD